MPRAPKQLSPRESGRIFINSTKGGSLEKLLPGLEDWQKESVGFVSEVVQLFGLPPSVGAIYGVLFSSPSPLCLDEITGFLGISKGSASQGLRQLREVGAVIMVQIPHHRREFFKPELSLKKLVSGFLKDRIRPSLESSSSRLADIERLAADAPNPQFVNTRLGTLRIWTEKGKDLLPLLDLLLSDKSSA